MFFPFKNHQYIAIIGDIKESRKLENRKEIQRKMNEILGEVNVKYSEYVASGFMITLGDEFQGLLCDGTHVMNIIFEIQKYMYPIKIRFGIGIGTITTEINREWAIGADGPGYYNARKAVEYLKNMEKKKQINKTDIRLETDESDQSTAMMINTILSLMTVVKESWTNRQREIIWDMLEYRGSQVEAARRLGIRQPTVQKSLASGSYYIYKEAFDTVEKVLGEIHKEDV